MKKLLELQKQIEIDFLKKHTYEQINDMFRELNIKLDNAESKVKYLNSFSIEQQRGWFFELLKYAMPANYTNEAIRNIVDQFIDQKQNRN